ncbi:MAG: hypothetical protein V4487_03115 [Chlamydiota bacterium]
MSFVTSLNVLRSDLESSDREILSEGLQQQQQQQQQQQIFLKIFLQQESSAIFWLSVEYLGKETEALESTLEAESLWEAFGDATVSVSVSHHQAGQQYSDIFIKILSITVWQKA